MRLVMVLTAVLFVCGCATPKKYQVALDSWDGETVEHLTARWGEPTSITKHDNGDVYFYRHLPSNTHPSCATEFLINNGVVRGWRSDGNCALTRFESNRLLSESSTWRTKEDITEDRQEAAMTRSAVKGAAAGALFNRALAK